MSKETKTGDEKRACTAKIGEKGQIVIPKDIRDMFDLKPGDTIMVLADRKRGIAIPPKEIFTGLANRVFDESQE